VQPARNNRTLRKVRKHGAYRVRIGFTRGVESAVGGGSLTAEQRGDDFGWNSFVAGEMV